MSRTVRGSFGQEDEREERSSSGRKSRKNMERKPTFLSFFKVYFEKSMITERDQLISTYHITAL